MEFYKNNAHDGSPRFDIGTNVWVINGPNKVSDSEVKKLRLETLTEKGVHYLVCVEYELYIINSKRSTWSLEEMFWFYGRDLYASEEEALAMAVWHQGPDLTDAEWLTAIGNDEPTVNPSRENSELGTCCGTLDNARSLLFKAKRESGLIERDRAILAESIEGHYKTVMSPDSPLQKIFEAFNISPKED